MVLAEFAGRVSLVVQELGQCGSAGPQVRRAARQLRRDHTRAQRIHAGEESVSSGGAALHGVVVHEDPALVPDPVNIGGLSVCDTTVLLQSLLLLPVICIVICSQPESAKPRK